MPLVTRRWYDIPVRAGMVATLVTIVVALSRWVGPFVSGTIALFPVVLASMTLILHPRIGGPATAAMIANGGWGMMGFGLAIAVLHLAALPLGSAAALSLALATCVVWNLGLWWLGRRRVAVIASEAKRIQIDTVIKAGLLRRGACHRARIRATRSAPRKDEDGELVLRQFRS